MPRHRRQRPSWLPAWVPYKDGRYLGLARQTILAWSSTLLAVVFFFLTIAYATRTARFARWSFVHASQANTILILRILSEAHGIFLAGAVYATFEVVQWVLISRTDGLQLPLFLALQSSTGPLGLLAIALGQGLSTADWPMSPRLMSLVRMVAQAVVPLTGVLIMSQVTTSPVYTPVSGTVTPFAFGMETFNGSLASQMGVWQDILFNMGYVSFLTNPMHAIDITPDVDKQKRNCLHGLSTTTTSSCARQVLITQEYNQVEANIPVKGDVSKEVALFANQQIYSLGFQDNILVSRADARCEQFTAGPASYMLCMRNAPDSSLEAAMIPCPAKLVMGNRCANETSWKNAPGFTTSLRPYFLNATVSYDRTNGNILSHEKITEPLPTNISASELLAAMAVLLDTAFLPQNSSASNPILGASNNIFGRLIVGHNFRIGRLMEQDPSIIIKGTNALQSLIAITLFYCQNGIMGQTVLAQLKGGNPWKDYYSNGPFSKRDKRSYFALAETRYQIEVGRATLIAYIVVGGITLATCILVLIGGSLIELARLDAEPTLWPALDFYTQCKVQDHNGKVMTAHARVEMAWIHDAKKLFKEMNGMKVTRRKRGHGSDSAPIVQDRGGDT